MTYKEAWDKICSVLIDEDPRRHVDELFSMGVIDDIDEIAERLDKEEQ